MANSKKKITKPKKTATKPKKTDNLDKKKQKEPVKAKNAKPDSKENKEEKKNKGQEPEEYNFSECESKEEIIKEDIIKIKPLKPKMLMFKDDECFGLKYDEIEQCKECWIKKACNVRFINRKR